MIAPSLAPLSQCVSFFSLFMALQTFQNLSGFYLPFL